MATNAVIEFAVQLTSSCCVSKVEKVLKELDGVTSFKINKDDETVIVETKLPSLIVQEKIESTGRRAVVKGYGGAGEGFHAVAMLGGTTGFSVDSKIKGVVRLVDVGDQCVIDGVIDGLSPGQHGLHIHELGDLSNGCDSIGDHFDLNKNPHGGPGSIKKHTGDLGNISAGENGRAVFRLDDSAVHVSDTIGRSLCVTADRDDLGRTGHPNSKINGNSGPRIACGIISRSSGIYENSKKICACDGVTLWDERDKPLAGSGRRA